MGGDSDETTRTDAKVDADDINEEEDEDEVAVAHVALLEGEEEEEDEDDEEKEEDVFEGPRCPTRKSAISLEPTACRVPRSASHVLWRPQI